MELELEHRLEAPVVIGSEVDIQSPGATPQQDDSVLLEGGEDTGRGRVGEGAEPSASPGTHRDLPVPDRLQRFYFESDALVLKNNADYQKLLKTLALLEAQKIQATKDLEKLVSVKARAERDPHGFVTALKNGTLEQLPTQQKVAEIPDINWKGYMDSVQKIVRQHSSVYQRTRRRAGKEPTALTRTDITGPSKHHKEAAAKPASYKQPWTPEEQTRLEELLKVYPPEAVERRRYEKVAKALGTRTPQQVASHVQKYFIKLAKAGLPVPGRMPNIAAYATKSKKGGRVKRLNRLSTFFSTLTPRVFMASEGGEGSPSSSRAYSPTLEEEEEEGEESTDSDDSDSMIAGWAPTQTQGQEPSADVTSVTCASCQSVVTSGTYWQCSECPPPHKTLLCPDCVNSGFQSSYHSPSHDMVAHSLLHAGYTDKDYTSFSQSVHTKYNYLDPNFFPAT